jgi:hypothetical protein
MVDLSLARAAQAAYNKAGFPRDEAFRRGENVARYIQENLEMVQKLYHIDDEIELAYRLAQATMAYELGDTET